MEKVGLVRGSADQKISGIVAQTYKNLNKEVKQMRADKQISSKFSEIWADKFRPKFCT